MRSPFTIIFILIISIVAHVYTQELSLDYNKLRFDVGTTELANLNYQYHPFGPITELKSHHYLGTLRLNSLLKIDFRTGGSTISDVVIDNYGYTKLGREAPSIKMKMLYGTSASTVNGATQLAHGLGDANRILSVQVHMNFRPGGHDVFYPAEIPFASHGYTYFWDQWNVTVQNKAATGTTTVLNKPIRVLVVYKH